VKTVQKWKPERVEVGQLRQRFDSECEIYIPIDPVDDDGIHGQWLAWVCDRQDNVAITVINDIWFRAMTHVISE